MNSIKTLPKFVEPYLWFNDLAKINPQKDKQRIILNVLNLGSKKATDWLLDFYPRATVKSIFQKNAAKGELSPKSLNYWCLKLKVDPKTLVKKRF